MTMLAKVITCLLLATSFVSCEVHQVDDHYILKPEDGVEGPEVAVLLVPGAYLTNDQYIEFGKVLQASSPYRLWVGLVGGFIDNLPNPLQLAAQMRSCMDALYFLGMDTEDIFLAGHSIGGIILESYGRDPGMPLTGVVLLGSYFSSGSFSDYPVPFLTLAGDLDGQTKITTQYNSFSELQELVETNDPVAKRRTPVVTIQDVNHAHYATGDIPPLVQQNDILSPLSKEDGQTIIASYVTAFMTITLNSPEDQVELAVEKIEAAYEENDMRMKQLYTINRLNEYPDGSGSPWTEEAQHLIINLQSTDNAFRFVKRDHLHNNILFPSSSPKVDFNGETVHIETHSHITHPLTDAYTAPREIASKMISQENLIETMADLNIDFGSEQIACSDINKKALYFVMQAASDTVKDRYTLRGRPIEFLTPDIVFNITTSSDWLNEDIRYTETDDGLQVRSVGFYSPVDALEEPGFHFCKLMPPSRVLEYVMVDSLRQTDPIKFKNHIF